MRPLFGDREKEVARLFLLEGQTIAETARDMKTSGRTVTNQLVQIYKKLGTDRREKALVALLTAGYAATKGDRLVFTPKVDEPIIPQIIESNQPSDGATDG